MVVVTLAVHKCRCRCDCCHDNDLDDDNLDDDDLDDYYYHWRRSGTTTKKQRIRHQTRPFPCARERDIVEHHR